MNEAYAIHPLRKVAQQSLDRTKILVSESFKLNTPYVSKDMDILNSTAIASLTKSDIQDLEHQTTPSRIN
jgi:hypothetical protein